MVTPGTKGLSSGVRPRGLTTVKVKVTTITLTVLAFLAKSAPLCVMMLTVMLRNVNVKLFSSPGVGTVVDSIPPGSTPATSTSRTAVEAVNRAVDLNLLALVFT